MLTRPDAAPAVLVDSSTVSPEASAAVRAVANARGTALLAAPVSGNPKVVAAGRLTVVASGPRHAYDLALPYLERFGEGVTYVGEGDAARLVKICHNLFLGVVAQSLAEITVLAEKGGVPRREFFEFLNASVMGSTFTRYKTPAYVNREYTPTFTMELLRKDFDLGLDAGDEMGVPLPHDAGRAGPRPGGDRRRADGRRLRRADRGRGGPRGPRHGGRSGPRRRRPEYGARGRCGRVEMGGPLTCRGRGTRLMQPIAIGVAGGTATGRAASSTREESS